MPFDAGFEGWAGYAPGYSAADFDPRALAARLTDLRERREIAKRDLARAQAQERRLTRLIDEADERGLDAVHARAFEMRGRLWLRIDAAAGACDDLSDAIWETEREIEEQDRLYQEAETRERMPVPLRILEAGGPR